MDGSARTSPRAARSAGTRRPPRRARDASSRRAASATPGYTGTSIWIDPERGLFVVLLTNRVNSRGEATRHVQLRRDVADAVQSAILDAPLIDWETRR